MEGISFALAGLDCVYVRELAGRPTDSGLVKVKNLSSSSCRSFSGVCVSGLCLTSWSSTLISSLSKWFPQIARYYNNITGRGWGISFCGALCGIIAISVG